MAGGGPDDVGVYAIVSVTKAIAGTANISPGVAWHQLFGRVRERVHRLAHPFDAAFDGVASALVSPERNPIHPLELACDSLGVVDDVSEAIDGIVPGVS